jgi:hypothetical protein
MILVGPQPVKLGGHGGVDGNDRFDLGQPMDRLIQRLFLTRWVEEWAVLDSLLRAHATIGFP